MSGADQHSDGKGAAAGSRAIVFGAVLAIGLALLAVLPVVLARYPQMGDYPAHLARWHVMREIGHDPWLARHFSYDWAWVPNIGADMAIGPLATLFGLEQGGRVLIGLIVAGLGLSFVATEWALRRRVGLGSVLALTAVWSPTLQMGFLSFALAEALAFFAFALWAALEPRAWRPLPFLLVGVALWFAHLAGWGVLGVLVFGYEWQQRARGGSLGARGAVVLRAGLATWPLWPPLVFLLTGHGGGAFTPPHFGLEMIKTKLFYWLIGLRDQSQALDLATVGVLLSAMAIAVRRGCIDGRTGRAALLLTVLTVLVPRNLAGGDFADYRLVPVALAAGLLAIDCAPPPRVLLLAAVPFMVRLGVTTQAWERSSDETAAVLGALDHVPRGSVVAGAWGFVPREWAVSPLGHVFDYATVRRSALTNAHFAVPGLHALQLARPDDGFVDPSHRLVLQPGERPDLAGFAPAGRAQFLWYYGPTEPLRLPPGAEVTWRGPHSLLARLQVG